MVLQPRCEHGSAARAKTKRGYIKIKQTGNRVHDFEVWLGGRSKGGDEEIRKQNKMYGSQAELAFWLLCNVYKFVVVVVVVFLCVCVCVCVFLLVFVLFFVFLN